MNLWNEEPYNYCKKYHLLTYDGIVGANLSHNDGKISLVLGDQTQKNKSHIKIKEETLISVTCTLWDRFFYSQILNNI